MSRTEMGRRTNRCRNRAEGDASDTHYHPIVPGRIHDGPDTTGTAARGPRSALAARPSAACASLIVTLPEGVVILHAGSHGPDS